MVNQKLFSKSTSFQARQFKFQKSKTLNQKRSIFKRALTFFPLSDGYSFIIYSKRAQRPVIFISLSFFFFCLSSISFKRHLSLKSTSACYKNVAQVLGKNYSFELNILEKCRIFIPICSFWSRMMLLQTSQVLMM